MCVAPAFQFLTATAAYEGDTLYAMDGFGCHETVWHDLNHSGSLTQSPAVEKSETSCFLVSVDRPSYGTIFVPLESEVCQGLACRSSGQPGQQIQGAGPRSID